jgi:transcriptional regulator with XRE-family HTH domain
LIWRRTLINAEGKQEKRDRQAQYLRELLHRRHLSAREVAWRSKAVARELGRSELAFSRQTVSFWLNGTRNPRVEHRKMLAVILEVPFEELDREIDGEELSPGAVNNVNVRVYGADGATFEYSLTLAEGVDLRRPAVYQHWANMFSSRPAPLMRHFRAVKYQLFGWIPDVSGYPLVLHAPCLVPLRTDRLTVESSITNQHRVWFVYLPDRTLEVGFAYQEGHALFLLKPDQTRIRKYPLSSIDLVGFVTGRVLFQIELSNHGS